MSFKTVNGNARTSDNDYIAPTSTLTFAPARRRRPSPSKSRATAKKEVNETFYIEVFGLRDNALFTKNCGLGTILNDD